MWKGRLSLRYAGKGQISPLSFIRRWLTGATDLKNLLAEVGIVRAAVTMAYIKKKFYNEYKLCVGYRACAKVTSAPVVASRSSTINRIEDYPQEVQNFVLMYCAKESRAEQLETAEWKLKEIKTKLINEARAKTKKLDDNITRLHRESGKVFKQTGFTGPNTYLGMTKTVGAKIMDAWASKYQSKTRKVEDFVLRPYQYRTWRYEPRFQISDQKLRQQLADHDKYRQILHINTASGIRRPCFSV